MNPKARTRLAALAVAACAAPALDNTRPSFHFEPVPYEATEIARCAGQPECDADVEPTKVASRGRPEGAGAMAFQVQLTLEDGARLASPGAEAVESGGLGRAVHKVAVRAADGYLGYLTELFDLPYIFGSDGPDGQHQADLLIGSDCADLAVYGARRAGLQIPYVSTWTLDQHAREVGRAVRSGGGIARDAAGEPLRIGPGALRPGDLLLFPGTRHVGVLYEDRDPKGVLDDGDLMLHTCWAPPAIERLADTGCASYPIRVLRFPPPPGGQPSGPGKRIAW